MCARGVLQYSKQSMVDDSGQSFEDQNGYRNVDSKGQTQEVSVGNKEFIGTWTKGDALRSSRKFVYILAVS